MPLLCLAGAATGAEDERVFAPGVQHVCVPAADGEDWDCGTADAPPENYTPPAADAEAVSVPASAAGSDSSWQTETEPVADVVEESPPPPPFLADPMRDTPYAPIDDAPPEPANAAEAVIAAEQGVPTTAPVPDASPAVAPEVLPEPVTEAVAVAPEPEPVAVVPSEPELATSPGSIPALAPPVSDAPLGDAEGFTQLPATAFTLQLAYASTAAEFPRLVAALGLDPATCYVLRVRGSNGATWLLAHGAFADANSAKAAQAQLPQVAGLLAQWPRRIGALQTEITQGL
ncbi:MAG TPA: hypothetical protein VN581_00195 [Patescibacteria group bacterium]|nr:hypothetical protein [Patescibacteria group bacterium]